MSDFCHLHCHTQYSLLDGLSSIEKMVAKAAEDGQSAVAITDHGNMFGAFKFAAETKKHGIKGMIGCEFYVVEDLSKKSFTREQKDKRYHQLILAKNAVGYRNLSKLCSIGFTDGLYGSFPRVDIETIKKYSEGLLATTCCIGAMVPQTIIQEGEEKGEEVFKMWWEIFGDDFFIELQRHDIPNIDDTGVSQEDVNQVLIKYSKKYNVPLIATNDSHYIDREDSTLHDILLCVNTGTKMSMPVGHGKGYRFGFPNNEFFFKTKDEMKLLFQDVPQAIENTILVSERIEELDLARDLALPLFQIPKGFKDQNDYLRHLSFKGAQHRYGKLTPEVEGRLNYELGVIKEQGFPGYFLIVEDFTSAARKMGVRVGPGRGSAAGSAVAYCIGITNVDPIKYGLLFERFLNPERISMPDIDIDFDDAGRSRIIDYVVEKYGKNQVAQIITYSKMAAKMSIRDVGRVQDLPLDIVNKVSNTFPTNLKASLNNVLSPDGIDPELRREMNTQDVEKALQLRKMAEKEDDSGRTIQYAKKLEGTIRNTGVHACGIIIAPDDLTNYVPITTSRDSDLYLTQFDMEVMESVGLLKMDFLGLRNLSIINDALRVIEERTSEKIDIDLIPLDDKNTFELFSDGETEGVFQFESPGMKKHLRALKPDQFTDLIAMNALYRPGPMQYIDKFINRKHGLEEVEYDLDIMSEDLEETYGITVYQEQVMLLSQRMAGFTGGEADRLRKAMGKKKISEMEELFPKFLDGCAKQNLDLEIVKKIWKDWEEFAKYAFNKSHATCYALVAYQTAYLKANYPAEYMAALLTNNMHDSKKTVQFMRESKRMDLNVLGPNINESQSHFTVTADRVIRFGLEAVKGLGGAAVKNILEERREGGPYTSIFNLASRVELRAVNKRSFEALALSGAFDEFNDALRAQYFHTKTGEQHNTIEKAIKYGAYMQDIESASQQSLFGGGEGPEIPEPSLPDCENWPLIDLLQREKEVVGLYITGHPLDDYQNEIDYFCTNYIHELPQLRNKVVRIAGILSEVSIRRDKRDREYSRFTIQDNHGSYEVMLFSEDFLKYRHFLEIGKMLYISGSINENRYNPSRMDFKVKEMSLLQEVIDRYLKRFCIKLSTLSLDEKVLNDLDLLLRSKPGERRVHFELINELDRLRVKLYSKDLKVQVDDELLRELDSMRNLGYNLEGIDNNLASRVSLGDESMKEEISDLLEEGILE